MVIQKEIEIGPLKKGFHNIDSILGKSISEFPETGILHIFVKHTSAGLMINENADPDVMHDLNTLLEKLAPENNSFYRHNMEGTDDMPAHFKSSVLGQSLTIPVSNHRLNLGTWQSVFFCEFRNHGNIRKIVLTFFY
jgi:secondary thiamine-phosphate synthase enzyme